MTQATSAGTQSCGVVVTLTECIAIPMQALARFALDGIISYRQKILPS